jgi:hypothetical protein
MYDKLDLKLEDAQVEGLFPGIITTSLMFFAVHPGRRSAVLQKRAKLAR